MGLTKDNEYVKKEVKTQKDQIEALVEHSDKSVIDQSAKIEHLTAKLNKMEVVLRANCI